MQDIHVATSYMLYTCYIHVIYMLHTCYIHVIYVIIVLVNMSYF